MLETFYITETSFPLFVDLIMEKVDKIELTSSVSNPTLRTFRSPYQFVL